MKDLNATKTRGNPNLPKTVNPYTPILNQSQYRPSTRVTQAISVGFRVADRRRDETAANELMKPM